MDATAASDIDQLMRWFPDADATRTWGGPAFRFPFNRHSFAEDIHWGRMASFSLRSPDGELAAFGQLYERLERTNLARLAVSPALRGQGVGRRLVSMLMQVGAEMFSLCGVLIVRVQGQCGSREVLRSDGLHRD